MDYLDFMYKQKISKVINPNGEILHVDWTDRYKALRRKIGVEFPGYMIHGISYYKTPHPIAFKLSESGQWSDVHKKWFFLPRLIKKIKIEKILNF